MDRVIDQVCDSFESVWQRGERLTIEEAVTRCNAENREQLLDELIRLEISLRQSAGETPAIAEYAQRFPDRRRVIESAISAGPAVGATVDLRPGQNPNVTASTGDTSGFDAGNQETINSPTGHRSPSTASLQPGDTLGRYEIVRELGRGGMGAVYLAEDPKLGRKVAVKIPFIGSRNADEVLHRFQREARAVAALHHPNICPIYEVTEVDGLHFMVMAFIEGRPLSDYIRKAKRLKLNTAVNLTRKLALTLDEAHRKGVVHRDLKPANVMIDARNEPQIMDFGLARLDNATASQLTATGQILGTPAYMPPEQVSGDIDATGPSSDIYSLGVMLYEMLTGRLPLEGDLMSLMYKIANETPIAPSTLCNDIPSWLDAICAKALAKKPEHRFASMREFAHALQRQHTPTEVTETIAVGAPEVAAVPAVSLPNLTIDTSPHRKPKVSAGRGNRNNKIYKWLAAAAAALPLLVMGGWIIKITNSDGTEQKIVVAADAKIEIASQDNKPKTAAGSRPSVSLAYNKWPDNAPPLAIAPFDAGRAAQHQAAWAKYLGVPVEFTNSIGMKFRLIPPGQFMMGAGDAESKKVTAEETEAFFLRGFRSETPQHRVVLSRPFFLSVSEITRASYSEVIEGVDKPNADEAQMPIGEIDFKKAIQFCEKLSQRELLVAPEREGTQLISTEGNTNGYRLPTEPEWEYACRAGTETMFSSADTPESCQLVGWIDSNGESKPHPVATRERNAFGIHDMHGNMWEWVEDHWNPITYQSYRTTAAIDPLPATDAGFGRMVRGGNYQYSYRAARAAARQEMGEASAHGFLGLRLVLPVEAVRTRAQYAQSPALAAATAIIANRGIVTIKVGDEERDATQVSDLPHGDFEITKVRLEDEVDNSNCVQLLKGMNSIVEFTMPDGEIPLSNGSMEAIDTLSSLKLFGAGYSNYFDDERLAKLSNLEKITVLDLFGNKLTDDGLVYLKNFENIEAIQVGRNDRLSGSGFEALPVMPSVIELGLGETGFTDDAVKNLKSFPNLRRLYLRSSKITDSGLLELGGISGLEFLEINNCPVSPEGVDRLQDALPNCRITTDAPPTGGWPSGLRFDGDDCVRTNVRYNGSSPITVEATVMIIDFPGVIVSDAESRRGIALDNRLAFLLHLPSDVLAVSRSVPKLRRLVRLSGVYDQKSLGLFVDGELHTRTPTNQYLPSEFPFMIGADPDGNGNPQWHFNGIIQSVRISNIARYTEDYDATVPYTADDSTLLMLDFTRPESELAKDMSKYNVPCEIIGARRVEAEPAFSSTENLLLPVSEMKPAATLEAAKRIEPNAGTTKIELKKSPSVPVSSMTYERLESLKVAGRSIQFSDRVTARFYDWDNDGDMDLLVGAADGTAWLFLNPGDGLKNGFEPGRNIRAGQLQGWGDKPIGIAFENMIGDELRDLIVGSQNKIAIHRNKGRATNPVFDQAAVVLEVQDACDGHFDVADWDGDGLKDVITGCSGGNLVWYRNNGATKFPSFERGESFFGLIKAYNAHPRVLDFNQDGKLDLLLGSNWASIERYPNIGTREEPILGEPAFFRWSDDSKLLLNAEHGGDSSPELVDLDRDGVYE